MRRLLGYLLRVIFFIAVAVWLADRPGSARIIWHDYVIECSAAFLGLTVLGIGFLFYLSFRLWHVLRHGPKTWRLQRNLDTMQDGHALLAEGLVALARGHAIDAKRLAAATRKKLGTTTATLLLQAQAAQLAHDDRAARALFHTMIEDPASAVLGYRGLIMEARRAGEWNEVERLTTEVRNLKTNVPWLDAITFENATRRKAWNEASESLARLAPAGTLDQETLHRNQAALLIAKSQDSATEGNLSAALEYAEHAARQSHNWLPALINLAQRQNASQQHRAARHTVERAWAIQPHPQLADIRREQEANLVKAYRKIERLCGNSEDNPASRLALADAAIAADIWGEARRHLMTLIDKNKATQATYRLLAKLEKRENGNERASLQWLTKAAEAPADPVWLCSVCGGGHPEWVATCKSCRSFATLEWRSPGSSHLQSHKPQSFLSNWSD